ncbi:adaptor protein MecA [Peribacillus acanthi]|uniref:adaptor protein MecA n=1 Tax=Peribacillus acanthi TaxID=2171554 RepID=UPI000D3E9805|nr:adaptor protein MecA [Peribacillus acanthi]
MKLERLNYNKIKIFLTFDDLMEYGLTLDDIKGHSLKVQKIFQSMIEEACDEMNFLMVGAIEIEIFSLHAQGLVIIVTREDDESADEEEYFDLNVKMGEQPHIIFSFKEFEHLIQLAHRLNSIDIDAGAVYWFEDKYIFYFEDIPTEKYDAAISLAAEYGITSTLSLFRIQEYGKTIFPSHAISQLCDFFKNIH